MTPTETQESSDPFVLAVREYILATLAPLIPMGESTGKFMFTLLRRALKSAERKDLEQVVLHCIAFADGLRERGFISEEMARQAEEYLAPVRAVTEGLSDGDDPFEVSHEDSTPSTDRLEISGPGAPDWSDEERQEHTGEAPDIEVLPGDAPDTKGVRTPESVGSGYETSMEGDEEGRWYGNTEAVSEDGAG